MWLSDQSDWDLSEGTPSGLFIPFQDLEAIMAIAWYLTQHHGFRGSKWNFDLNTDNSGPNGHQLVVDIVFLNPDDATIFKLSYNRQIVVEEYLKAKKSFEKNFPK